MKRSIAQDLGPLALALAAVLLGTPAAAQQAPEGPRVLANVAEIKFGGRVQTQLNTTTVDGETPAEIFLRRVRLEAEVRVNDLVSGKIQPDFAGNRLSLKDAYVKLNFSPGLQVLAGNAHRPFGLLEQTSSTLSLPIERGVAIRGLDGFDEYELVNSLEYSDRDVGLQVMGAPVGAPLGFTYAVGYFQGPELEGLSGQWTPQFAARATIEPLRELTLGAGWSSRGFAREADIFRLERGSAVELDLEYGAFDPGFHLLGEVAFGDFDPVAGQEFFGAQGWVGYRTAPVGLFSTVEPIFRASYGTVDGAEPASELGGTLLTPGLNLYLGGRNRISLNYDFWLPEGDQDRAGSFKAQFQVAF